MRRRVHVRVARRAGRLAAGAVLAALLVVPALPAAAGDAPSGPALREGAGAGLRSWLRSLPPERRRAAVRRLRSLSPEQRRALRERWQAMDESERAQVRERLRERARRRPLAGVPPDEAGPSDAPPSDAPGPDAAPRDGAQARRLERWRAMKPEQRQELRRRLDRFSRLPADEQAALVERRFAGRSPEERARILERLRAAAAQLGGNAAPRDTPRR